MKPVKYFGIAASHVKKDQVLPRVGTNDSFEAECEWVFQPYYGAHETRTNAMRAMMEMDGEVKDANTWTDEQVKRFFRPFQYMKYYKVIELTQEQVTQARQYQIERKKEKARVLTEAEGMRSLELISQFVAWTPETGPCPISINDKYWFTKLCALCERIAKLEARL